MLYSILALLAAVAAVARGSEGPNHADPAAAAFQAAEAARVAAAIQANTGKGTAPGARVATPYVEGGAVVPDPATDVVLVANDDRTKFLVPIDFVRKSSLLRDMLDDHDGAHLAEIPIPNAAPVVLQNVVQYMFNWGAAAPAALEKPLRAPVFDVVDARDAAFLKEAAFGSNPDGSLDEMQHGALVDLVMAANFLGMADSLLPLTTATVASLIRGKTPEQIRALFQIPSDAELEQKAAKKRRVDGAAAKRRRLFNAY